MRQHEADILIDGILEFLLTVVRIIRLDRSLESRWRSRSYHSSLAQCKLVGIAIASDHAWRGLEAVVNPRGAIRKAEVAEAARNADKGTGRSVIEREAGRIVLPYLGKRMSGGHASDKSRQAGSADARISFDLQLMMENPPPRLLVPNVAGTSPCDQRIASVY